MIIVIDWKKRKQVPSAHNDATQHHTFVKPKNVVSYHDSVVSLPLSMDRKNAATTVQISGSRACFANSRAMPSSTLYLYPKYIIEFGTVSVHENRRDNGGANVKTPYQPTSVKW